MVVSGAWYGLPITTSVSTSPHGSPVGRDGNAHGQSSLAVKVYGSGRLAVTVTQEGQAGVRRGSFPARPVVVADPTGNLQNGREQ